MTRLDSLHHDFVEFIPDKPRAGTLYISIPYTTAVHLCACGCEREVVTPLSPTDWKLTFDGETVSLSPSIGNWSFECQSHYWIEYDRIRWAGRMTREQIDAGRVADSLAKEQHHARQAAKRPASSKKPGRLRQLLARFSRSGR